ncbi:MAG: glycerophosphodiester phosphodiesterase family protein [Reichenbachiella sp.]
MHAIIHKKMGLRSISHHICILLWLLVSACHTKNHATHVMPWENGAICIAAHRGGYELEYEDQAPENSIANIKNAINHGFDIYESDLRRTSDGRFIIMHDATLDRTTNGTGRVDTLSWNAINQYLLTFSGGELTTEKIPLLEDFLLPSQGKIMFKFDYKAHNKYLPELIDALIKLNLNEQIILRFSYDQNIINEIKQYDLDDIPHILFRVESLAQFQELKENFKPKMISIVTRNNEFNQEHLQIIALADQADILIEVHSFHDNDDNREHYWAKQIALPINIFHTQKPLLFQEFLNRKKP